MPWKVSFSGFTQVKSKCRLVISVTSPCPRAFSMRGRMRSWMTRHLRKGGYRPSEHAAAARTRGRQKAGQAGARCDRCGEGEAWPAVTDADELYDVLVMHGFLTDAEITESAMERGGRSWRRWWNRVRRYPPTRRTDETLDCRREDSAIRGPVRRNRRTRRNGGSRLHPDIFVGGSGTGTHGRGQGPDRTAGADNRVRNRRRYGPFQKRIDQALLALESEGFAIRATSHRTCLPTPKRNGASAACWRVSTDTRSKSSGGQ